MWVFICWDMFATIRFTKLSYRHIKPLTEKLASKVEMAYSLELKSLLHSISNCKNKIAHFWCCRAFLLRHSSLIEISSVKGHLFHMILGQKRYIIIIMVYNIWTMVEQCIQQIYHPHLRSSEVCQNCKFALTSTLGNNSQNKPSNHGLCITYTHLYILPKLLLSHTLNWSKLWMLSFMLSSCLSLCV